MTNEAPEVTTLRRYLGTCEWWVLCDRPATHRLPHPVLGSVPICDRCQAKLDAMEVSA